MNPSFEKEILDQLNRLAADQQQRVLEFARALEQTKPVGVAGKELLPLAGTIELADLQVITQTIEAGCERIDQNEW